MKFWVRIKDFGFSAQNQSSKSILQKKMPQSSLLNGKATQIESFLKSIIFTPQNVIKGDRNPNDKYVYKKELY